MNRNNIIIGLVLLALAYGTGRYLQPAEIETRTETIIKEVEVIKKDIEIIKEKETRPDGTVIERETSKDKSETTRDKDQSNRSETIVQNQKPQWKVQGLYGYDFKRKETMYGAGFEKRYMGPVSVGLWLTNQEQAGISGSFEF